MLAPVGTRIEVEGQVLSAFLFSCKEEADAFVHAFMECEGNIAAGVAQLDTGTWRVVIGRHYDA